MWRRKRRESAWTGMAAGLIGGLLGSVAIGKFDGWWAEKTKSRMIEKGTESIVNAAQAISENVLQHPLTEEEKPKAGSAVHYAFGGAMGALYGAVTAMEPRLAAGFGAPFGASVFTGASAIAVPALGLGEPITKSRLSDAVGEMLGHAVYGVVTDLTRRGVVRAVRAI